MSDKFVVVVVEWVHCSGKLDAVVNQLSSHVCCYCISEMSTVLQPWVKFRI